MSRVLGLVESPAQLLNAVEWAAATGRRDQARLVVVPPADARTRLQLHRLGELATADGFSVGWCEVRSGTLRRARALGELAALVAAADQLVLGDPYSGVAHLLLNGVARRGPGQVVVVDDGTATLHFEQQWAAGAPLQRWHLGPRPALGRAISARAQRLLGNRSSAVQLFTAMPVQTDIPVIRNEYAWTRARWPAPQLLEGTDLLGSSLAETGTIDERAYLGGIARLVAERGVRRYLPHRREASTKLAEISAMGVELVRPDLPMEVFARRGPTAARLLSFPSTVLHTLPLVLAGSGIEVEPLDLDARWFTEAADDTAQEFLRRI